MLPLLRREACLARGGETMRLRIASALFACTLTVAVFVDTKNFSRITSTRDNPNDPREIQLALKFYF